MTAEIVWRNPSPPAKDGSSIARLASDSGCAMYEVSKSDAQQKFELIFGMELKPGLRVSSGA
jgi:hypothetical protein